MDQLLQKLMEAEVLTEETKKELLAAFQAKLDEATGQARESTAADVRAQLTEQWVQERDALIEAVDTKVTEFLKSELDELKGDIEKFRDLEAEYAEKLVEAKTEMGEEVKKDLAELVEKLDTFLEIRLAAELEELEEDIKSVRQNEFGKKIFETFVEEFRLNYADEGSTEASLRETQKRLDDALIALEGAESERQSLRRKIKLEQVLSPLNGRSRDIMEAILKTVSTDKLDEGYKTFIGRVLKESTVTEDASEKEGKKVLAEGASEKKKTAAPVKTSVVTGDTAEKKEETKESLSPQARKFLQESAGIVRK